MNRHHLLQGCNDMEVNFFERRKILKKSNALDLIPVRLLNHEQRKEGELNILLPRFKRTWLKNIMGSFKKEEFIRIKLDSFGSATWLLIDGKKTVREISDDLGKEYPEKLEPPDETPERVNKFMSVLYQQRFISFQQLQKGTGNE
ncbi:MAG: PqqD family protein [Bacteroidales bacterium]|nr:PqqD family protein [Bacteroidales bacterium]